jgi:hypothetical protein
MQNMDETKPFFRLMDDIWFYCEYGELPFGLLNGLLHGGFEK